MSHNHQRDLVIFTGAAFIGSFSVQFWHGDLWPTTVSLILGCVIWVCLVRAFVR